MNRCAVDGCQEDAEYGVVMFPEPFHLCNRHMKQWVANGDTQEFYDNLRVMELAFDALKCQLCAPTAVAVSASSTEQIINRMTAYRRSFQRYQLSWLNDPQVRGEVSDA